MLSLIEHIENTCKTVRNTHGLLVSGLYSLNSKYKSLFPCPVDKQVLPLTLLEFEDSQKEKRQKQQLLRHI